MRIGRSTWSHSGRRRRHLPPRQKYDPEFVNLYWTTTSSRDDGQALHARPVAWVFLHPTPLRDDARTTHQGRNIDGKRDERDKKRDD